LIIETKGQKKDLDYAKWEAAKEWVKAVNYSNEFGQWNFLVIEDIKNIFDEIAKVKI